jgi:putative pyruvate formate lyase activating enzyme
VHIIQEKKEHGSRNVNWVGGEPTPNLLFILHVLQNLNEKLPQVWNSNMYCSQETMSLLNGIIDIYLTDFKFGNNECAKRLSGVDNYIDIIKRNHLIAFSQGELIIRHLILPNHIDCCSKPILTWIHKELPRAIVNIMDQYRPEYRAKDFNEISRPLKNSEYEEVLKFAQYLDITII